MYRLFSVDDHIVEPADVWTSRLPAKFVDVGPRVIEEDGREFWLYEDAKVATMGLNAVVGKPREEWGWEPVRFADMRTGCYNPVERARDLQSQGIYASVNFPTLPGFGGRVFAEFKDLELATACVRAWNDFILDEWCPSVRGQFVPMTMVPFWDPPTAELELRRCLNKGAKALCFVEEAFPFGYPSFYSDFYDPIWGTAHEAGIPVCMHIGSGGIPIFQPPDADDIVMIALGSVAAARASVSMMLSPVPRKFPDIKLVYSEGGIGWVPAAYERADRQWERHGVRLGLDGPRPSEVCKKNMYFCMIDEPIGLSFREHIGVDHILWEADYPHADCPFPNTQWAAEQVFAGVPDEEVAAITHRNAEELFNWKMAEPLDGVVLNSDASIYASA